MNPNDIATKSDVEDIIFAIEQLRELITSQKSDQKFLRSSDVKKLLNISDSSLQRLRINKTLPASKVNGTWFYKQEDVIKMVNGGINGY
jgi:hypothetical protein